MSLAIAKRPRRALRIGTLSWNVAHGPRNLELDIFEAALQEAVRTGPTPDLILSAGLPLATAPTTGVLPRTAIVFEAGSRNGRSWYFATSAGCGRLRGEQLVFKHNQLHQMGQLAKRVARGQGWIHHPKISLLLLICGENNALNTRDKSSALRGSRGQLSNLMGNSPWIVLNPAHGPYKNKSRISSYAKIGSVAGYPPTLQRLVLNQRKYGDGTRAPFAVIHCNNFDARAWTHQVASRCFARQSRRIHRIPRRDWRYVLYELSL